MANPLPTPDELLAIGQTALRVGLDGSGTGAIDINPGSRHDLFLSVAVALAARNAAHIADRAAARSPRDGRGDDLDETGIDIYNSPRKPANAAVGTIYLARTSTNATYIPQGSRFTAPASGSTPAVVFSGDRDVPVSAGTLSVAVPLTCTETGAVGNVLLSSLTAVTDPLPVTDWVPFVPSPGHPVLAGGSVDVIGGGDDGEIGNDLAYSARLLKSSFDAATSPGLYEGVLASVLAVQGIFDATVIEPADGTLRIFCGDVNYMLPVALRNAVLAALPRSRCFGVPAFVLPYTVVRVAISGSIYMNRPVNNYDTNAVAQRAVANTVAYFQSGRASPDSYFLSAISAAYETADDDVQSVVLATPGSDVRPASPAAYATLPTINRYVADAASISVVVLDPQTS